MNSLSENKEVWTRHLLREIQDMGLSATAKALEEEMNISVDSDRMIELRTCLKGCAYDQALQILAKMEMRSAAAYVEAKKLILKCKYVNQLLEEVALEDAVVTLQRDLVPLLQGSGEALSSLAMMLLCANAKDADNMRVLHKNCEAPCEDFMHPNYEGLVAQLECLVSQSETIPKGELRKMIHTPRREAWELSQGGVALQWNCTEVILEHTDDIWSVAFSHNGQLLATGSKDEIIIIWDATTLLHPQSCRAVQDCMKQRLQVSKRETEHIAWSFDDTLLISCGTNSSSIYLWNIQNGSAEHIFRHPDSCVSSVCWLPGVKQFITGSTDKSMVLWHVDQGEVREWRDCAYIQLQLFQMQHSVVVYALAISSLASAEEKNAFVSNNYELHAYTVKENAQAIPKYGADIDEELLFRVKEPIASIKLSSNGKFLLVNYIKKQSLEIFDIAKRTFTASTYSGFHESRYVLTPCFTNQEGLCGTAVACGSEDGSIYVWDQVSAQLMCVLEGHRSVVNVVESHPAHTSTLISVSDDETIRVWKLCF